MEPRFLTVEEVIYIHRRSIEEHGGSAEMGDRRLLESAVGMAAAQFGGMYLHTGLPAMAAAYHFHLCKNHPFADGNKRIALAAAETFLELNDHCLIADDLELEHLTLGVADSSITKEQATAFFQSHATPHSLDS